MIFAPIMKAAKVLMPAGLMAATLLMLPQAQAASLNAQMSIYFKGIPVGIMTSKVKIKDDRYSISGTGKTNAVVSVIVKTKGNFKSSGTIKGRTIAPDKQSSKFKRGKKRTQSALTFENSNVVKVSVAPPIKYKKGSVPVVPEHFQNVVDPVSSLLFPLAKGEQRTGPSVCNRTVPVFSGKSRMDLVFKFKKSATSSAKGFNGTVYTCSAKYKPVSGHRPKSKTTKYMAGRNDIEVSMAEIGDTGVFALFAFSLPIRQGVISGLAQRYASK